MRKQRRQEKKKERSKAEGKRLFFAQLFERNLVLQNVLHLPVEFFCMLINPLYFARVALLLPQIGKRPSLQSLT